MNTVIYEYILNTDSTNQVVKMPDKASILKAALQGNNLCIWVHCNPEARMKDRIIILAGTGHVIPGNPGEHIDTIITYGVLGSLVIHAFDGGYVNS